MKNSLYERIHDLRERSGMTQTDLALRMGVTRSGVNAWEMGISKPTLDNLVTLSRIFHTTTDYLLGDYGLRNLVYTAPLLIGGGLGLLIAFIIETKMGDKK